MARTAAVYTVSSTSDLEINSDCHISEMCDLLDSDPELMKDAVKELKKRLGNKNPRIQLEALNNIETLDKIYGDVFEQICDSGMLHEMVTIVKKKPNFNVKEKILVLINNWQYLSMKCGGKPSQFYAAYQELLVGGFWSIPTGVPAAVYAEMATSDKLISPDSNINDELCSMLQFDRGQTTDVMKVLKKRLGNKNPHIQLLALTVLETMSRECDEDIYASICDGGILDEMVTIVKKKPFVFVKDKILVIIDDWQYDVRNSGFKYPQFYAAYQDLKSHSECGKERRKMEYCLRKKPTQDDFDNYNNENGEEFPAYSAQAPLDFESQAQTSPMTKESNENKNKGKRPRPHEELREEMNNAMKDVPRALIQFCEKESEKSKKKMKVMEQRIAAMEEKKLEWSKKQDGQDATIEVLLQLEGISELETFKAMKLFENLEMRRQFLCLPHEMRLRWLKFNFS